MAEGVQAFSRTPKRFHTRPRNKVRWSTLAAHLPTARHTLCTVYLPPCSSRGRSAVVPSLCASPRTGLARAPDAH